jgi:hypothetical protein
MCQLKCSFFCGAGAWTQALHLEHSTSPFFVMGFFEIGFHKLFAWGWLQTVILLISVSWVPRITGVNHCTRSLLFFFFGDRVLLYSLAWLIKMLLKIKKNLDSWGPLQIHWLNSPSVQSKNLWLFLSSLRNSSHQVGSGSNVQCSF